VEETIWGQLTSSICKLSRRNDKNDDASICREKIFYVVEYIGTMFAILLLASVAVMSLIYFLMPPVGICHCPDREVQPEIETEPDNEIKFAETNAELSVKWEDTEAEVMGGETEVEANVEIPLDEWRPSESFQTVGDINETTI